MKKTIALLLISSTLFCLAACAAKPASPVNSEPPSDQNASAQEIPQEEAAPLSVQTMSGKWIYITELEQTEKGSVVTDENGNAAMVAIPPCYALMNVPYCENPAGAEVQFIDIYVPAEYMIASPNGDGTYTCTVREDGSATSTSGKVYTAATAPVILQNSIDAYKQSNPISIADARRGGGVGNYYDFISSGYVLVSLACRGSNSSVGGYAPAAIYDMKAAVRCLKANDAFLPGDMNKIIATGGSAGGGSAGGGMASLLGASGNSSLYEAGLAEMGAVMDSTDDIFGVAAYCPITNLDSADGAYEWLHIGETKLSPVNHGDNGGGSDGPKTREEPFSDFELALQQALYNDFLNYLKELGIDPDAYYQGFLDEINECIANHIEFYVEDVVAFAAENTYLSFDGSSVTAADVETFVSNTMGRSKGVPSFDTSYLGSNENTLFRKTHFSQSVLSALQELSAEFETAATNAPKYAAHITDEQLQKLKMMTPNTFLTGEENSAIAPHWRFCIGTCDGDLGASTAWLMTNLLETNSSVEDVEFNLIWGKPHGTADYSFEDIQQYIDSICE